MALTITATPDPTTIPPSVLLELSDPTGSVQSATVVRVLSDRPSATVRTSDGNPLQLSLSGGATVGALVDYEAPYGVPVTYVANGSATSSAVLVDVRTAWLVDPTTPARSVAIRIAELGARARSVVRGVFQPIGRRNPIVVTDGSRRSHEGTLSVLTLTDAERRGIEDLIDSAGVLMLNAPSATGWGVDPAYVSFGDSEEARISPFLGEPGRRWTLPYIVVDAPLGGTASSPGGGTPGGGTGTRTWADLALEASTWAQAAALYPTWADAAAG